MNAQTIELLDIGNRPENQHGPSLEYCRAEAQKVADRDRVDVAIGWQINDTTGEKELGWCPATVAPSPMFVVQVLEIIRAYQGGRADYAQRQESRRDRLETAAERAAREASSRFNAARSAIAGIPPGQPILVGHHSERRHRRDLATHDRNMRAAIDADQRAGELAARAESVGEGGISSDDPQALVKLREELAKLQTVQERMKAANATIRKHRKGGQPAQVQALVALDYTAAQAEKLITPDFCGRIGFPDYALKNNGANIRRIEARIEQLQKVATIAEGERARSQSGVVFQVADNRVQLVFPGKPAEEIRKRLKSSGFRWAPTAGAWQRHLNNAGIYHAQAFIAWLDQEGR